MNNFLYLADVAGILHDKLVVVFLLNTDALALIISAAWPVLCHDLQDPSTEVSDIRGDARCSIFCARLTESCEAMNNRLHKLVHAPDGGSDSAVANISIRVGVGEAFMVDIFQC